MPTGLKRRPSQANGTLLQVGSILWKHLADFLKTNPRKVAVVCVKKRQKPRSLRPKSSKIIVRKEKERARRRRGGEENKLVEEICKITQSRFNCQTLQYEIHFILCSCKIEISERKKIARKHRYSSFEYCKMEPLKKKHLVTRRKENRQIGV